MGVIAPWYLRNSQLDIYQLLQECDEPFVECCRQFGKTTTIIAYTAEELIKHPGWIATWCEPEKNQAREIVIPILEAMQRNIPEPLKFKYRMVDSLFHNAKGSILKLRGVNEDRGDSARGTHSHLIIADEIGSWLEPEYVLNESLMPQLTTTRGKLIRVGTPPRELGHEYYRYKDMAMRAGKFVQKVIWDNESLSQEDIKKIMDRCGGEKSPAWLREYLCEPVSDTERLVIPEYDEQIHVVDDDYPRPPYYDAYVGIDLGITDQTAALFGWFDFIKQELVIEDEFCGAGLNTKTVVEKAIAKEVMLWGHKPPYMRISDNEKQQILDMLTMFNYQVLATRKDDKVAAINALRVRFSERKIKIKRRCKSLQYQLRVGLWNERRTGYARGEITGHLDCIDALVYLHRNLDPHHNPYPSDEPNFYTQHVPEAKPELARDLEVIKNLFPGRKYI